MASKLTKVVANFESSLATKLSAGAVSGSLSNVTDKNGVALPTGKYCMIVNRGTGDEEHLIFDLTGSAMTNIVSVSRQGVQTSGVQNANGHRVGVKVYLTDFVNLKVIVDILNGVEAIDATAPLKYDADPTFSNSRQLVSKGYVDAQDAAFVASILSGNNNWSGLNTFAQSPQVPNPVSGNDAVNMATLIATVLGGGTFLQGFTEFSMRYDSLGRVESVHEAVSARTFFIRYRSDDPMTPYIVDGGDTFVIIGYNGQNLLITGNKK